MTLKAFNFLFTFFVWFNNQAGSQPDVLSGWSKFSDFQGTNRPANAFRNDKIECFTGKYGKLSFPNSLKLFSSGDISTKAGNILSFLGSSVVFRTLSDI